MKSRLIVATCVVLSGSVVGTAQAADRCSYGADLNLDGVIDVADLVELLFHWGNCHVWNPDISDWEECPTQEECVCAADLNADETVGVRDLLLMITKWGPVEECPECDDAIDNDGDGLRDELDPGCWNVFGVYDPEMNDESIATTKCQDGIDNDGDGLIDFPNDPGCGNRFVNTEVEVVDPLGRPACSDGLDNDNDGTADWGLAGANDCFCSSPFDDSEQDVLLTEISWYEFPDFYLNDNLTVVYGGLGLFASQYYPDREDFGLIPLARGFSHIKGDLVSPEYRDNLPFERRAGLWSPSHSWVTEDPINDEYWENIRSPWGNDIEVLDEHWRAEMASIADLFSDSRDTGVPHVEYLVADIEQRHVSDERILAGRDDEGIPFQYRSLPDDQYVALYKEDMTSLYDFAVSYPTEEYGTVSRISSYSDAPISNAKFGPIGIGAYSWEEWTSDLSLTDYIMANHDGDEGFGEFFNSTLDLLTPSGYYLNDYPRTYEGNESRWSDIGRYVAMNLFKIDANQAWAPDKEIILFQAMRFHLSGNCPRCGISRSMAHVAAILPFFSEGVGSWVFDWDGYTDANPAFPEMTDEHQSQNRIAYDNYIFGLYRVSQFNEFFDEGYSVYHPTNARDLYADREPIWRGVYSADRTRMLVAATDPYAAPDARTQHVIEVDGQVIDIVETTGSNVYMGVCDLVNGGCVGDEGMNVK